MKSWLDSARPDRGGLFIPGGPDGRGADLLLTPNDVQLLAKSEQVALDWQGHSRHTDVNGANRWSVCGWGVGNTRPLGVGLNGPASTAPIQRATGTLRNKLLAWNPYNRFVQDGVVVPLFAPSHSPRWIGAQQDTMHSLCTLLAERPSLRPLLADPKSMSRLASDLAQHSLANAGRVGMLTTTVAVVTALRALGYEHNYFGRPLPADQLEACEDIVTKVLRHLAANRYGAVTASPKHVAEIVNRYYLDIQPWPFAALGI